MIACPYCGRRDVPVRPGTVDGMTAHTRDRALRRGLYPCVPGNPRSSVYEQIGNLDEYLDSLEGSRPCVITSIVFSYEVALTRADFPIAFHYPALLLRVGIATPLGKQSDPGDEDDASNIDDTAHRLIYRTNDKFLGHDDTRPL